jgi:hypothetical protein
VKYFSTILAVLLLAGCTGSQLPLAKEEPVANAPTSLVKPPWEALVQAGPDAGKDVDLETLNGPDMRPTIDDTAPAVATAEAVPPAQPPAASPAAAEDGAIRNVFVQKVAGRDGQGVAALTEAMRQQLSEAGWPVLNSARKDALTVAGTFKVSAAGAAAQTVAIDWTVKMPSGKVLGVISQKNDVSAASLGDGWQETANAAAGAAADGIFQLIGKVQGASQ